MVAKTNKKVHNSEYVNTITSIIVHQETPTNYLLVEDKTKHKFSSDWVGVC